MALRGSQAAVLWAISESPKDPAGYVSDEQVARLTEIAIDDARDCLITLEEDGLVSIARTTKGYRVQMEVKGRIDLREHQERSKDPPRVVSPAVEKGHPFGPQDAELAVEFADLGRDDSAGHAHLLGHRVLTRCHRRRRSRTSPMNGHDIPSGFELASLHLGTTDRLNHDYFRELANYEFARRLFRPVRVVVKNVGPVAASSVRAELTVPPSLGVMVMDSSDMPCTPKRRADRFAVPGLKSIRPAFRREPGEVVIEKNNERFRVSIDCGSLQPGRRVWSEVF